MSDTPEHDLKPKSGLDQTGPASPEEPSLRPAPPPGAAADSLPMPPASPAGRIDAISAGIPDEPGPGGERLSGLGPDRQLRVLVVEDSRLNALVLTHLLVRCSCVLHCAADGRQALDCLRRNPYDLVLMDIEMPVMDGIAATQAIRSGEVGTEARDIPIVAITAHTTEQDRARCLKAGMDGFVPRPFAPETLAGAIRRALARERN